jgi:hypothetical protein
VGAWACELELGAPERKRADAEFDLRGLWRKTVIRTIRYGAWESGGILSFLLA